MIRGRIFESTAEKILQMEHPDWNVREAGHYFCDESIRLGGTPDLFADIPGKGFGTIQIKTVQSIVYKMKWLSENEFGPDGRPLVVPPLWIGIQALVEAHLTGAKWAKIGVMVVDDNPKYGATIRLIDVPIMERLIEQLRQACVAFWENIASGVQPDPDYSRDQETINYMFDRAAPQTVDLSTDNRVAALLSEYNEAKAEERQSKDIAESAMSEIKHKVTNAANEAGGEFDPSQKSKILLPGDQRGTWVAFERKGYRVEPGRVRYLNLPKPKKA